MNPTDPDPPTAEELQSRIAELETRIMFHISLLGTLRDELARVTATRAADPGDADEPTIVGGD